MYMTTQESLLWIHRVKAAANNKHFISYLYELLAAQPDS